VINLNHEFNQKGSKLGIIHSPKLQILSIVLLIVGLVPFLFSINSTAYAVSNGQDASVVLGQSDFTHGSQNQGGGTTPSATSLRFPQGTAFDSSGNLWVVDSSNSRILEYTTPLTTGKAASVVLGQLNFTYGKSNQGVTVPSAITEAFPHAIAFDSSGNLWVADANNNRILEYTTPLTTGKAASVVLGQLNFTYGTLNQGGTVPTAITEDFPQGIAFDSSGNLWVADSGNNRILEYTTPLTTGKAASVVLGQLNFTYGNSNQGGTVPSAITEAFPQGIAFDSSGNLWLGDSSNSRILEYTTPLTTGKAASVVLGQSDFTHRSPNQGGGSTPSVTGVAGPQGIAFDSSSNLWIADSGNNRTLEYTTPLTTGKAASAVLGQSDFTTGISGLSQNKLNLHLTVFNGPTFDSSGNLWIGDENNNRILEFVLGPSPSIPEFPIGGIVLMFAVSGAAYAAIRYRAMRISSL